MDYFDKISKAGIKIEYGDVTMRTKLFERSKIVKFDTKTLLNTDLVFEPYWDYNSYHTYTIEKFYEIKYNK